MKKILFVLPLLAFLALAPLFNDAHAGTMSFDPSSVNVEVDEEFTLTVQVDVGTSEVLGVDALIEYDAGVLEVVGIQDGTFLSVGTKEYGEPGKIYIAGLVDNAAESVTGSGPLADVTFKAIAGGTSDVTFICREGETGESNISENSTDATDLIECSSNGEAVVVVAGGTTDGGTSGGTGGTDSGSTPSELPQTGFFEDMILFGMVAGVLLLIVGAGTRFLA